MKKLIIVTSIFLLLILMESCSHDTLDFPTQNTSGKLQLLNESDLNKNYKALEAISKYASTKDSQRRGEYDSVNDFYVNMETIISYEKENYSSLTFSIYRTGENDYVENLILVKKSSEDYAAYLAKYIFTQEDKKNYYSGVAIDNLAEKTIINDLAMMSCGTLQVECQYEISYTWSPIPENEGDLPDWSGPEQIATYTLTGCTFEYRDCPGPYYGGGAGGGSSGGSGGAGGGSGSGGGGNSGGPVEPVDPPDVIIPLVIDVGFDRFINSLYPEHINWAFWIDENPEVRNSLEEFFRRDDSISYSEKVAIVKEIIEDTFKYFIESENTAKNTDFIVDVIQEILDNIDDDHSEWTDELELLDISGPIITNIDEYLECFDITQPASFVLYVDQPSANSNSAYSVTPGNVEDIRLFQ